MKGMEDLKWFLLIGIVTSGLGFISLVVFAGYTMFKLLTG